MADAADINPVIDLAEYQRIQARRRIAEVGRRLLEKQQEADRVRGQGKMPDGAA
jgi:hypothetical protein